MEDKKQNLMIKLFFIIFIYIKVYIIIWRRRGGESKPSPSLTRLEVDVKTTKHQAHKHQPATSLSSRNHTPKAVDIIAPNRNATHQQTDQSQTY